MKNYSDITFIIPLRCESKARLLNLDIILHWIKSKFNSPVIVKENNTDPIGQNICSKFDNVQYIFEKSDNTIFHRTKLLNDMLLECKTKYISNFDCDVILPVENLNLALQLLKHKYDFVYPYTYGRGFQKRIHHSNWEKFKKFLNLDDLNTDLWMTGFGHCFIAKTDSYIKAYGENENFIGWGPEDLERFKRFKKLNFNTTHLPASYFIYHIEHTRTQNSCNLHSDFENNNKLEKKLNLMNKENIINYYKNLDYVKNRKFNSEIFV